MFHAMFLFEEEDKEIDYGVKDKEIDYGIKQVWKNLWMREIKTLI